MRLSFCLQIFEYINDVFEYINDVRRVYYKK